MYIIEWTMFMSIQITQYTIICIGYDTNPNKLFH